MAIRNSFGEDIPRGRVLNTTDTTVTARNPGFLSAASRYGVGAVTAALLTPLAVNSPDFGGPALLGAGTGMAARRGTHALGRHLPEGLRAPLDRTVQVATAIASGLLGNAINGTLGFVESAATSYLANGLQGKMEQIADGSTTITTPLARPQAPRQ